MLLHLLALLAALASPDRTTASVPGRSVSIDPPAVHAIVATSEAGDLCVVDPETAALVSLIPAHAVDLVPSRPSVHGVRALALLPEGDGEIATYVLTPSGLVKTGAERFTGEGGRLLDASGPMVGYSFEEGTTLFSIEDGASTGAAEGYPRSALSLSVPSSPDERTIVALEDDGTTWRLRKSHVAGAEVVDLGVQMSIPHAATATASLVEVAGQPVLVSLSGHSLAASAEDGSVLSKAWISPEHAEIADAISLGERGILVLTRPTAKLFLFHGADAIAIPMKGAGTISDAPWYSHRLVLDPGRDRAWIATDAALIRLQLGNLLATRVTSCKATSVTALWEP